MPMLQRTILASLLAVLVALVVLTAFLLVKRRRRVGGGEQGVVVGDAQPGLAVTRLPPDVPEFVGRQRELDRLRAMRPRGPGAPGAAPPVCVVTGRPGVGKTALAVRLAHSLRASFPDGVLYLNLHGSWPDRLSAADALGCLQRALGAGGHAEPSSLDAQAARFRSLLAGKRILFVFDDAADAAQVGPLLPDAPGCFTLVTSRNGLDLTGAAALPLEPLTESEAVAMLSLTAGRRRLSRDPVAAATVARTCENLPLALHIAGTRMRARPGAPPLVAVADQLMHERLRLDDSRAANPGVLASLAVSYGFLSAEDATLFRRLALLPGQDFAAPVASALIIAPVSEAERGLDRLATQQLLERVSPDRYRFHDVVRYYAQDRLNADETAANRRAARRRALSSYLAQTKAASEIIGSLRPGTEEFPHQATTRAQQTTVLAWFERERLNLAAAVRLAADTGEHHLAWRLAARLAVFLDIRDYTREWIDVGEAALHAARASRDPFAVAVIQHDLGDAHRRQGHIATATAYLSESLKGFAALDSPQDEARALVTLGQLHQESRELLAAVDDYRRALAVFRAYGSRRDEIEVFTALGVVRRLQGRLEEAAVFLEEALELVHSTGTGRLVDDLTAAVAAENLGMVHLGQDDVDEAAVLHAESLATFQEIGARRSQAYALRNLGECARRRGALAEAAHRYQDSLALLTVLDDRAGQGLVWSSMGRLHIDAGRWAEAAAAYEHAAVAFREVRDEQQEGVALLSRAKALLKFDELTAAEKPLRQAEQLLSDLHTPEAKEIRRLLAELDWADGPDEPRGTGTTGLP
jgi:tetratricopeptide (TPR) repeat protein